METNVSVLPFVEDQSPPSSPLLPEQEQQEVVEEDKGLEENVALKVRPYVLEPLNSANNR